MRRFQSNIAFKKNSQWDVFKRYARATPWKSYVDMFTVQCNFVIASTNSMAEGYKMHSELEPGLESRKKAANMYMFTKQFYCRTVPRDHKVTLYPAILESESWHCECMHMYMFTKQFFELYYRTVGGFRLSSLTKISNTYISKQNPYPL